MLPQPSQRAPAGAAQVGVGRDGHPLLYGPPLIQLAGAFPLEQPLMGQLVPQSINVWMGCAPEGAQRRHACRRRQQPPGLIQQSSQPAAFAATHNTHAGASSGLHHDFHDNLYVLLRGVKRFRLFPPSAARGMYMHGSIAAIHPNGRIVYEGQGDINADGSGAVRRLLGQQQLQLQRLLLVLVLVLLAGMPSSMHCAAATNTTRPCCCRCA